MLRILIGLASGVAVGLAFEPTRLVWLLPLGIAGLVWCVHGTRTRTAALHGLLFGAGFMLTLLHWLRVIGVDAWLALSLFEALYFAGAAAGMAVVARLHYWPVWTAAVWLAVEVIRGSWPMGGLTWGRISFATIDTPLERWFPWIGANGVSFLVALLAAGGVWCAFHVRARPALVGCVAAAGLAATFVPWLVPIGATTSESRTARVAIVQGDVPGNGDDLLAYHRDVTRSHLEATRELAADVRSGAIERPDFVIWPENATAVDPFRDADIRSSLAEVAADLGSPILVGAIVDATDPDHVLNQGIVYDPVTGAGDRYTKRHPVPFGEYIPYRDAFGKKNFGRLAMVPRDMLSGTRTSPLRIGDIKVADVICFDISYDDTITEQVRAGAELLAVQTSNAMFIHTGQIEQQWAISRIRALETGRSVVVAAVNGRSGVIGPDGDVISDIDPRTRDVLVDEVTLVQESTPAMVVGPWLGRLSVVVALGALVLGVLTYRRGRNRRAGARPDLMPAAGPAEEPVEPDAVTTTSSAAPGEKT
ncbi:apolipoprotein N-acyltransferase [Nocardioides daedukensis]|uniref:Apolipoprotein N-acyltransferase n=1 Tax=Nocardioides daedukensis TaxID=634462 RepID=A0A7Y9RWP9_9ACTN|nr:apolipoprotein N-acyltransferase [Nocardioides daedukensis]